jgi:AraC family cel operon transcriptional repressor
MEKIYALSSNDRDLGKILLRGILVEALMHLSRFHNRQENDMPLWFESLMVQMQKKENFTKGLPQMYELCGRSRGHLNRVFKQYLNTTPTGYINDLRLKYAKYLLSTTYISVIDISLEAGFDNLSHFYHLFKKNMNTAPCKYRARSHGRAVQCSETKRPTQQGILGQ